MRHETHNSLHVFGHFLANEGMAPMPLRSALSTRFTSGLIIDAGPDLALRARRLQGVWRHTAHAGCSVQKKVLHCVASTTI